MDEVVHFMKNYFSWASYYGLVDLKYSILILLPYKTEGFSLFVHFLNQSSALHHSTTVPPPLTS